MSDQKPKISDEDKKKQEAEAKAKKEADEILLTEKDNLEKDIAKLENENKILTSMLSINSPETIKAIKDENAKLKEALEKCERLIFLLCKGLKAPVNAGDLKDQFETNKAVILEYCQRKNLDSSLWKNLESL